MYLVIWEYRVRPDQAARFVDVYGANGRWAEFFRESTGYQGTVLLKSNHGEYIYITLDYWDSQWGFEEFLEKNRKRYETIDRECEDLTESELKIGEYVTP